MRGDQLSRQWRVLRLLEVSKKRITANKIAELSGTSLRTAYRDLDDLQLAGFHLYSETRDGCQCWKFVDTYKSNLPFPFTYTELMSLHMSRDLFKIFKGTVFFESLQSLFDKVIANLPPETKPEELRWMIRSDLKRSLDQYKEGMVFQEKEPVDSLAGVIMERSKLYR